MNDESVIMPVGKYRGRPISELSTPYLRWALENLTMIDDRVASALLREVQRRRAVLGFENASGDRHAPSERLETEVDIHGLIAGWKFYRDLFEQETGVHLMQPALGFRTNEKILGTWYPGFRRLVISNYWILPRKVFRSVLVHEMCHQFITDTGQEEHYPHGERWRAIAARMAEVTGLDVTRTTPIIGFVANERRRQAPGIVRIYDEVESPD